MDDWVTRFHAVVDELAAKTAEANGNRITCREGCSGCCTDGLTVFEVEADLIVARHQDLLENGEPHGEGACAFLDERGACRIYDSRPYVCRTQGLPLRWIEETEEGPAEARDICPLNDETGPPLEELPADRFWTIGPFEERLAGRGDGTRVALRELFAKTADSKKHLPVVR